MTSPNSELVSETEYPKLSPTIEDIWAVGNGQGDADRFSFGWNKGAEAIIRVNCVLYTVYQ